MKRINFLKSLIGIPVAAKIVTETTVVKEDLRAQCLIRLPNGESVFHSGLQSELVDKINNDPKLKGWVKAKPFYTKDPDDVQLQR